MVSGVHERKQKGKSALPVLSHNYHNEKLPNPKMTKKKKGTWTEDDEKNMPVSISMFTIC
jgi:hypothetical protein